LRKVVAGAAGPGALGKRFVSCAGKIAGTEVPSAVIIGGGAATGAAGAAIQEKEKGQREIQKYFEFSKKLPRFSTKNM
jgi:hypothetical protein